VKLQPVKTRKPHINITSLIDVLFLLLIFFMVSSTFLEKPGMKLDLPKAETSQTTEMKEMVLAVNPDNTITLDGSPIDLISLQQTLEERIEADAEATLILRADETVTHGTVVEVMDVAKKSGIVKLIIATREE
jgi:biopolymer transport protein ExbD